MTALKRERGEVISDAWLLCQWLENEDFVYFRNVSEDAWVLVNCQVIKDCCCVHVLRWVHEGRFAKAFIAVGQEVGKSV